mmetsp:Transcript_3197/g.3718  ORF Transcript_3197/g.3718 Transcript_3197/m.3718 type:complete len:358 (+) Transcript_3197:57-1130(+)
MPSSKKKRNHKKSKLSTETGIWSRGGCCSNCGTPETPNLELKLCARCGMAVYCSRECQRLAYKEHKKFCKQTAVDFNPNDRDACSKIMFSRCFGGAVSLLMYRAQRVNKLKGVIHVKCSHPLVEYCSPRRNDNDDKRSLEIRYVPEGQGLLELQERALSDGQSRRDEDGMGSLEAAMLATDNMASNFRYMSDDMDERLATVAIEQPNVLGLKTFGFFSYMGPTHPAHVAYEGLAQMRNILQSLSECIVLDWDWDSRQINKNQSSDDDSSREYLMLDGIHYDYPIQWLCYNAVGAKFHQSNSLAYQESVRTEARSPWPNGELRPPLALGMELRLNDVGTGNEGCKYSMTFTQCLKDLE